MSFEHSLVMLRVFGAVVGAIMALWSFQQFRLHLIRRGAFLMRALSGLVVVVVAVWPDSVNVFAHMLSLDNRQYGRLIALLLVSNMVLWFLYASASSALARQGIQFDLLVRGLAKRKFLDAGPERCDVMVLIPALNEADNLRQLLPQMPTEVMGRRLGVLVIDDGSTDDTVEAVRSTGKMVCSSPINRGGGAALRLGYDIAYSLGAEVIVTMDGDGQHMPQEIEQLVTPILRGEADIVIGSRLLGSCEHASTLRRIGVPFFNAVINFLAGTNISDCSSGFRAFKMHSLRNVLLLQDQFHTAELIIDAAKKGLRITEAPITIKHRLSGQSKKGQDWSYGYNFFKVIMKTWFR